MNNDGLDGQHRGWCMNWWRLTLNSFQWALRPSYRKWAVHENHSFLSPGSLKRVASPASLVIFSESQSWPQITFSSPFHQPKTHGQVEPQVTLKNFVVSYGENHTSILSWRFVYGSYVYGEHQFSLDFKSRWVMTLAAPRNLGLRRTGVLVE